MSALRCSLFLLLAPWWFSTPAPAGTELTIMSFNAWGAGLNEGKPVDETVAVLRAIDADIIGLQESRAEGAGCLAEDCPPAARSVAPELADALGYYVHEQDGPEDAVWANAVLSRYPILGATSGGLGVVIDVDGTAVHAFNVHAPDSPYQPYQVLGIPYGEAPFLETADALVAAARAARGHVLEWLLEEAGQVPCGQPAFVFGDFNEPSHRDWTSRAAAAGRHPLAVEFPFTRGLEARGFVDAYRTVFPDEMEKPGYTWTPTTSPDDPADHHDRIDYVFVRGVHAVTAAHVAGEARPQADIVVTPWPSDHRAVVVTVVLE